MIIKPQNANTGGINSHPLFSFASALVAILLCVSCGSLKSVPDGSYAVSRVSVSCTDRENEDINTEELVGYARQRPNPRISLFRKRSKPVIYDSLLACESAADIENAVRNLGYLRAHVAIDNATKGKKIHTRYIVTPDEPYFIRSFATDIHDPQIDSLLASDPSLFAPLQPGRPFSVVTLNNVRNNVTSFLADRGYYRFNKDYIAFTVDTLSLSTNVDVLFELFKYHLARTSTPDTLHSQYSIRSITYSSADTTALHIRHRVLVNNTAFRPSDLYSAAALRRTYNNFAHLGAVRYTNVSFTEVPDSNLLDCHISLLANKPSSISIQPEGTNTAGDFGAALILAYDNNNIFHGSELLSIQGRVAYEAIRGLEGYSDQDYQEYSIEAKLTFPRFFFPFRDRHRGDPSSYASHSTEVAVSYNLQNRPEFHRRLFSASWRYRWANPARGQTFRFDLLDLNYIYMPWISETFRQDYLDNNESRNAILRYNYEDLFIMKLGFGFTITRHNHTFRTNLETAGNFLHALALLTHFPRNREGQHTLFRIAYAQYVKGDFEYTYNIPFDANNSLALHAAVGIAYPYGNSTILPFEKRYFSGGANSVRGWSVRSLGPGRFHGHDGRIDFINQTGDVRLDLNAEFRAKLFWRIHGAVFVDAGNIWTLRHYDDQEGGQFRFTSFYRELAAAYGLGVRLHLGYFILRLDFGMKAVNPDYTTSREHFPIYHPKLDRDLAVHFAVGLPF